MINIYLGIDPGKQGGMAAIAVTAKGTLTVKTSGMPEITIGVWEMLDSLSHYGGYDRGKLALLRAHAYLEKVGGFMGPSGPYAERRNRASAHGMFTFGKGVGHLQMALVGLGIAHEEITPQAWQKALSIPPRKKYETDSAWKNRLVDKARKLFPDVKVTQKTADALLIAEVCRRRRERL